MSFTPRRRNSAAPPLAAENLPCSLQTVNNKRHTPVPRTPAGWHILAVGPLWSRVECARHNRGKENLLDHLSRAKPAGGCLPALLLGHDCYPAHCGAQLVAGVPQRLAGLKGSSRFSVLNSQLSAVRFSTTAAPLPGASSSADAPIATGPGSVAHSLQSLW